MTTNRFNLEALELLAAGYILDDLDEEEKAQVEQLIRSSPAMEEQIHESAAVMKILATEVPQKFPSLDLKNKIIQEFEKQNGRVNLENWFQQKFDKGWERAAELLINSSLTLAFRNIGVGGGKKITIGSDKTTIILIIRVAQTSCSTRDITVEILPELAQQYLPKKLQIIILDSQENVAIEATTREDSKNIKFEFSATSQETFSLKLVSGNNFVKEDFLV